MEPTDFNRFHAVMAGMGKLYDKELDSLLLDAYWMALRDWALKDFEAAAAHLMGTATFMPRPAEFNALRKAGEPTGGEAWAHVLAGKPLEPGSVMARTAEAVGGQKYIRMADIEHTLPHIQRRFLEAYEEISDAQTTRKAIPQITGQTKNVLADIRARAALVSDQRAADQDRVV